MILVKINEGKKIGKFDVKRPMRIDKMLNVGRPEGGKCEKVQFNSKENKSVSTNLVQFI